MHLQDNASKWWQTYKQSNPAVNWKKFATDIQETFGPDDHRSTLNDLLDLKQTSTVEEYTTQFKSLQYDVSSMAVSMMLVLYNLVCQGSQGWYQGYVEPQVPTTVERALVIAKLQQKVIDRSKLKYQQKQPNPRVQHAKPEVKTPSIYGNLWRDKQLRDYRKANNLCYHCGEKYEPGHAETYAKRNKPQLNALVVNDLDKEINEDLLNEMAIDEMLTENFGQLSLNAMAGTETTNLVKLKATVKNKTMLILVDTGSSHNFVSSHFINLTQLPTVPIEQKKIKLANGN